MNTRTINVLLIEDSTMQQRFLSSSIEISRRRAFQVKCAGNLARGIQAMTESPIDVVLLDLTLPDSSGRETLTQFLKKHPDAAVVILTSTDDDDLGEELVEAGAQDYLVKSEISTRALVRALTYAVERKRIQVERERMRQELQDSERQIETLHGLLPICGYCKKIRDDTGYWNQIERYISAKSPATFTHGVCPDCARHVMEEYVRKHPQPA